MRRFLLAVVVVASVPDAFPDSTKAAGTAATAKAPRVVHHIHGQPFHGYPLVETNTAAPAIVESRDKVLKMKLVDGEALWGFGERFDAWNMRGHVVESWARDMAQGGPHSSYFAVPFFISSGGYGLFVNCTGKVVFDCGATKADELRIEVPEPGLDVFVFRGTPREIVKEYTKVVGRPQPVPDWVFQPWISRNSYVGAYEIDHVIDKMEANGLKGGVVVLEAWAQGLQNFKFEERRYPEPGKWIEKLHDRGYHVVLWETPSIWTSASTYPEAKTNGWLVLNADGTEYVTDWLENGRKIDFRETEARTWWTKLHEPLVEMGVDGFKTDGGERAPDPWFHNLQPYYYQRAVLDAFTSDVRSSATAVAQKRTSSLGVTFARSASPPCAGNSTFWAGDQSALWNELPRIVRAGLSAAISGFSFWGHDIGGYTGTPTKKLYIRWLVLGVFSPIMQLHGITPREPWYYDEETVRIAKFYFDLRWALQPYLLAAAKQTYEHGTPIWRPLILDFPDDGAVWNIDDEFMFGDDLLVAPVLNEFDERKVYLPAGAWVDVWSKELHTGPKTMMVQPKLAEIPVFARNGGESFFKPLPVIEPVLTLTGATNERGVVPTQRIWRGQRYEKVFLRVRGDEEVTLDVPPGFEVVPSRKQSGERVAFYVMWPKDCEVGTYPVTVTTASGALALQLVKLPDWNLPVREDGYVDLGKVSEVTTTIRSERGGRAHLWLGSGDGITVWLNGERVFDKQVHRGAERDEDVVEVTLEKGENQVRVKISRDIGPNGLYFRVAQAL